MDKLGKFAHAVEQGVIRTLLVLTLLLLALAALQLVVEVTTSLIDPPYTEFVTVDELLVVFGAFLMVLIGLELVEVIKVYREESLIRVELVLIVALIAVAKKIIVFDYQTDPLMVFAVAALVIALAAGYFLLRRSLHKEDG